MFSDTETVDVMFYQYERLKDHKIYRVNTLSESITESCSYYSKLCLLIFFHIFHAANFLCCVVTLKLYKI